MANNFDSNVQTKVIRKFLDAFQSTQVLSKTVNTQLIQGELNPMTGQTVGIKRPIQLRSTRTANGDVSGGTAQDITSGKVLSTLRDYITVEVTWSQLEQALETDQLVDFNGPAGQLIMAAATQMVADLEVELAQYMNQNLALQLGSPGTAIDAWGDVASTKSYLTAIGAPVTGQCYSVMGPFAAKDLANAQAGLASGDNRLVNTAWEQAQITGNFGGTNAMMSNALATHTNGAHAGTITVASAPTQTYVSVKDSYILGLPLSGFTPTTGGLTAGTVLEISGVNFVNPKNRQTFLGASGSSQVFQCVVTADVTADGSGDLTAQVTAPIFEADGAYNNTDVALAGGESVTVVSGAAASTQNPSLFYHENAIGLATVELPKLITPWSKRVSEGGLSINMHMDSSIRENTTVLRFDMLPAFATFNPLFGGRFYGQ